MIINSFRMPPSIKRYYLEALYLPKLKTQIMRIFILFTIIPFCLFSQNNFKDSNDREKRSIIIDDIHLGFNNFMTNNNNIVSGTNYSLKSLNSVSLSFNTYVKTKLFKNNIFFLKYGIGLTSNNYKFLRPSQLIDSDGNAVFLDSNFEVKKSKLVTTFLDFPIMMQLDFKEKNSKFNIALGPFIGYMLKAKSKFIYTDSEGDINKEKANSDFSLNKMRYGIQGEIGIFDANFYFKYHISSLFLVNRGPEEINVIDFGVRLFITPTLSMVKKSMDNTIFSKD